MDVFNQADCGMKNSHLFFKNNNMSYDPLIYVSCDGLFIKNVHLIVIYVSDLLVIMDDTKEQHFERELIKQFSWISLSKVITHSYLQMLLAL